MDYCGVPYVFHPYHLAEQMDDEISCTVALLHDVVEDTDITLEALQREFPKEVTDAVALLTHDESVDYLAYVQALGHHPVARKVKLADLAHNSDETRDVKSSLSQEQKNWWKEKYGRAKAILLDMKDE